MLIRTVSIPVPNPFPPQEPYLAVELPPRNSAEQDRLRRVQALVQAHRLTTNLTTLAGEVRLLMGEGYVVGGGALISGCCARGRRSAWPLLRTNLRPPTAPARRRGSRCPLPMSWPGTAASA